MRRVGLFTASVLLRAGDKRGPPDSPLDEARAQQLESEAAQRGFMRRDSADAKVYMETHLVRPERIGGGVPVANLPPVEREKTEFDVYQRSTRDFTSQVTPYGTTGVGLGAGFGARDDARLGFLRPRKLQPFGGESSIVPKYDESGMPIDESLTKEQLIKKRMAYMKSFEGTTMSHREHFLLVDLDFEKDAMIFGNTREEFERNVTKLKEVISTYTKWERTDNFYYYGTIALKALTVWVLMECLQQYYELGLLAGHYDDFVEAMEETLGNLEKNLQRDLQRARDELQSHRPDFSPVVEAIRREKRRLLDAEATRLAGQQVMRENARSSGSSGGIDGKIIGSSSSDSHNRSAGSVEDLATQIGGTLRVHDAGKQEQHTSPAATQTTSTSSETGVLTVQQPSHHPMDTTREQEYLASLRQREAQREMRRLQESVASSRAPYSALGAIWSKLRFGSGGGGSGDAAAETPLQQEDFARLSYAASPTSIDTLRAIRRILLPRSEDYIQVVREELLEYKQQKETKLTHPE
ncbi:hypothetical protein DQ04_14761000 [Trypanosoma grayi]|uniref:hypothetical protein n=1 Tax=Trypanosoma grayi TaxID=71804 RepID=UPI0004F418B5|nr:hypothetical protein DQ04_14761000 [Trypanosoma grayi]KEG06299.1 hypothetical protein DQ04_14761000 [Trypanosoma grayi]